MDLIKSIRKYFAPSFRAVITQVQQLIETLKIVILQVNNFQSFNIRKPNNVHTALKDGLKFAFLLFTLALISSCDYNRRTTGWQYFDDMVASPAYESYTPNPNFADGKTMQPPVPGTIPRGTVPYAYEKTEEDRALAAATLENPVVFDKKNLDRGKKMYGIYCMQCHGEKGDGQGSLYVSKKYTFPPASLLSEKMLANPEADIYHVITVGQGIMGEHGSMIRPADRWKIAMYVKEVLQN
ncbi:c-type cytochrome [Draconibacterium halophilum]|uniref:Cytochrome c n=1 Tax=Draconibacterium halophilum TaxID=2706887 RepID=A0A6C0RAE5_9BACT|nr:cytochrome c [Draconibacterium halophilum]QIA06976.1 cytochrome c [Draconibacterium halophilum]